jgi:arylsulfatase A-like enzyme
MGFHEWLSHDNFFEMNPWLSRNGGPPKVYEGESSEIVVRESLRFIDKAKQSQKPFFVVIWFGSPHEPYSGLKEDLALYNDLPEEYHKRRVRVTGMEEGRPVERPLDEVLQERYAEITAMDRAIGQLRLHLKKEGLRQNTLLWFCSDNGVPAEGNVTSPFRGQKGRVYEGGVRVPGIIEWPERIPEHRLSNLNGVTSDLLPTTCDVVEQPVPDRPLDGISLKGLIEGEMDERSAPICFWSYDSGREAEGNREPYIDPTLQSGTTPLVKMMDGRFTRNFGNLRHPSIAEQDFAGPKAILDNRYKLVIDGEGGEPTKELFDLRNDRAEEKNLVRSKDEIARKLEKQLRDWQESVMKSLTGADY